MLLLCGAAAVQSGGAPLPIVAQIRTFDLSESPVETVIPAEYNGGFFARIGSMVVSDRGIWIVDRGQMKVLWFDPDGRLRMEYGRDGAGPGEFLFPADIRVDSVLTVVDPRLGRIVRFGFDGSHLETTSQKGRPIAHDGMEVPLGDVAPLRGGFAVGATAGWYGFGKEAHSHPFTDILLFHPDGTRVDTLASYHINAGRWDALGRLGGNLDPPFGRSGSWTALGDSMVVLADGIAGTLTRISFRGRSPVADTLDLGMRARPVSSRDLAEIEARLRDEKPNLPRRLVFDLAEGWSVATGLLPGQENEFWLRQAVGGEQQVWVVVKPETREQWRVILPARFALTVIYGGRLYGVARDELDVPSVGAIDDPRPPT